MKIFLRNQKGQAVFEMVLFLPFLVILYSIFYTVGNSVSGSINQQKAVRGYFYHLVKNNSYINTFRDIKDFENSASLKMVGFGAIGWREKSSGGEKDAFAPCFSFISMIRGGADEDCDSKDRPTEGSSNFIRVFTFYGVCGPVYSAPGSGSSPSPLYEINPSFQNSASLCALSKSTPL